MQANDVDGRVRRRLKEIRAERGMTLDDVARRAGIDVSTLSRLESGKRRLALDHLPRLAEALSVTSDELLAPVVAADPRVRGASFTRDDITFWPLTRHGAAGGLQAYKIRVAATRVSPPATLPTHEGHEWAYVLSGRLRLLLGEQDVVVDAGDAVEFSTRTPHWIGATAGPLGGPVEAIAVFGAHGERLHVRAHGAG